MKEVQLHGLDIAQTSLTKVAKPKENIEEAAEQFEGLFIKQMLSEMWKSVPKSGLLGSDRASEYYYDMYHESLADEIASHGGIGIKEFLAEGLRKYEQAGSKFASKEK